VVFSQSFISDAEAKLIIDHASSTTQDPPQSANTKSIESQHVFPPPRLEYDRPFDPTRETYELMNLKGEPYLCIIPIVEPPVRNRTLEAEAKAAEQKELARATDRGWELLQGLEKSPCLYFQSGWWSYEFCYNEKITQFHQLPPQPGKPAHPQPDPTTKEYVLGRARPVQQRVDEWGNQLDLHKGQKHGDPPKTELQVKGDTRYLVQRMDGGTTCDLTGKPRKVEIQYHCNLHHDDRIGYIKEVTTCSYLMVIYTPRLCNDVAFLPPKETKANEIVCRVIVPEEELLERIAKSKSSQADLDTVPKVDSVSTPVNIGGITVGAGKWANKEGQRLPIPKNFGQDKGVTAEIIAKAKSKADGGQVEVISDAELQKMDLDPEMVEQVKKQVQEMAQEKGWQIKVVDAPGQVREILGIVDLDEEEEKDDEGSEEIFKEEL
jgi:protein OS-9